MRGKGRADQKIQRGHRITPACAGKRDKTGWTTTCPRDHPRVCGEKQRGVKDMKAAGGSPPRMRGKAEQQQSPVHLQRITPAYAGKSSLRGSRACSGRDHPRVCGEKRSLETAATFPYGSPPRMRGKEEKAMSKATEMGITPAYAGKRGGQRALRFLPQDHPRVCGEKGVYPAGRC